MSVPARPSIGPHRTAGWKPAHNRSDPSGSGAKKHMHVIGHQCPRAAGRNHLLKQDGEPLRKILPAFIILENPPLFDSPDENMAQSAGSINAGLTRHGFQIPLSHLVINKETASPLLQCNSVAEGDNASRLVGCDYV